MPAFEYKVVTLPSRVLGSHENSDYLQCMGNQHWELVNITTGMSNFGSSPPYAIFKRPRFTLFSAENKDDQPQPIID